MFGNKRLENALISLEKRVRHLETRPTVVREIATRKSSKRQFMSKGERNQLRSDIVSLLHDRKLSIRQMAVVLRKDYKTISNHVRDLLFKGVITKDQISYKHHGRHSKKLEVLPLDGLFTPKNDEGVNG